MTIFLFMLQLIATIICIFTSIWIIFNRNDTYKKEMKTIWIITIIILWIFILT